MKNALDHGSLPPLAHRLSVPLSEVRTRCLACFSFNYQAIRSLLRPRLPVTTAMWVWHPAPGLRRGSFTKSSRLGNRCGQTSLGYPKLKQRPQILATSFSSGQQSHFACEIWPATIVWLPDGNRGFTTGLGRAAACITSAFLPTVVVSSTEVLLHRRRMVVLLPKLWHKAFFLLIIVG
jgi:hypothetical protein